MVTKELNLKSMLQLQIYLGVAFFCFIVSQKWTESQESLTPAENKF